MNKPIIKYCKSCTTPISSAIPIELDDSGIVQAVLPLMKDRLLIGKEEKYFFENLIDDYKSKDNYYDCIIPVSGGKDSYWQIHKIKEYGLNPLLVTYHQNNYTGNWNGKFD